MMAKQLLLAGANPTDAYCHCGFGDYSNFYRAFKAEYGIGPKEFAKKFKKNSRAERDFSSQPLHI
ncbi:MAG: helix-turn-helix domain-containing protein [Clostridia bacterium]